MTQIGSSLVAHDVAVQRAFIIAQFKLFHHVTAGYMFRKIRFFFCRFIIVDLPGQTVIYDHHNALLKHTLLTQTSQTKIRLKKQTKQHFGIAQHSKMRIEMKRKNCDVECAGNYNISMLQKGEVDIADVR